MADSNQVQNNVAEQAAQAPVQNTPTIDPVANMKFFERTANVNGKEYKLNIQADSDEEADTLLNYDIQNSSITKIPDTQYKTYRFKTKTQNSIYGFGNNQQEAYVQSAPAIDNNNKVYAFINSNNKLDDDIENDYLDDQINILNKAIEAINPISTVGIEGSKLLPKEYQDKFKAVNNDVATGLVNSPSHVVRGITQGIEETVTTGSEILGKTVLERTPQGFQDFMNKPIGMSNEEYQALKQDPNFNPYQYTLAQEGGILKPRIQNKSVTGSAVESISQFITGMEIGGRFLKGWNAEAKGAKFAKEMAKGAFADFAAFDPQQNLSDLVQTIPQLANPINEYLAGNEDDSQLELRLKNAIEGGIIGVGTEAVSPLVKALKDYKANKSGFDGVKVQQQAALEQAKVYEAKVVEQSKTAADLLGKQDAPLVESFATVVGKRKEKATDALKKEGAITSDGSVTNDNVQGLNLAADGKIEPFDGPHPFRVNFGAIEAPEDVKNIIETMLKTNQDYFSEVKGKPQSWQVTKMKAGKIINDPDQVNKLLGRPLGTAVNASEMNALEVLADNAAIKLGDIAKLTLNSPTDANKAALAEMMSTFNLIKGSDLRAGAEAGRALNMRKAIKKPNAAAAEAILNIANGDKTILQKAAAIANLADMGKTGEWSDKIAKQTNNERIRQIMQMVHMSAPSTQTANILGNMGGMLMEIGVRKAASELGFANNVIKNGESEAMWAGMVDAFHSFIKQDPETLLFLKNLDEGKFADEYSDIPFPEWAESRNPVIKTTANVLNSVLPWGTKAAGFMDKVSKVMAYRASLYGATYRKVQNEVAEGVLHPDGIMKRAGEIYHSADESMLDEAERLMEEITYSRKQEYGLGRDAIGGFKGMGRIAMDTRKAIETMPMAGGWASGAIIPFVNTTSNLMSYVMRSSPIAPLMYRYQRDIAEGGARAAIAKARMTVGSIIGFSVFSLALNGAITGQGSNNDAVRQAQERAGRQPYSIKIGDNYYSFERMAPLGMLFAIAGNLGEQYRNFDHANDEHMNQWNEIVAAWSAAIGDSIMDQSLMQGVSDLFVAITDKGNRQRRMEKFQQRLTSAPVPALVRLLERLKDPYARDGMTKKPVNPDDPMNVLAGLHSFVEQAHSQIPGLSETLPIRRDLWGKPVMQAEGEGLGNAIFTTISPFKKSTLHPEPIDAEMMRLYKENQDFTPLTMPKKVMKLPDFLTTKGMNIEVQGQQPIKNDTLSLEDRPDIYNEFLKISGEWKLAYFNNLITGNDEDAKYYQSLSDKDKYRLIKKTNTEINKQAWEELCNDPKWMYEIAQEVDRRYQNAGYKIDEIYDNVGKPYKPTFIENLLSNSKFGKRNSKNIEDRRPPN